MNMMSLVAGFVGVPLLCWLVFGVLPGGAERAAALQKLNLSNIELAAMTLDINLLLFSGTFLCLFRNKRHYLKEITEQKRQIGKGADIKVSKYTSPQGRIRIALNKCQGKMELILSNPCPELAEQELQHLCMETSARPAGL